MRNLLISIVVLLLCLNTASAETVNPFEPVAVDVSVESGSTEVLRYDGVMSAAARP